MTTLFGGEMSMAIKLDLLIKDEMLLSLLMGLLLPHGHMKNQLLQFTTLVLELLLLNFSFPAQTVTAANSPLIANLWLVVLVILSTSGTLPTQPLTLLGPSLDTLKLSDPLHFPPPSSHHLQMDQSRSGSLVPHQWNQLQLVQSLHHLLQVQSDLSGCKQMMALLSHMIQLEW